MATTKAATAAVTAAAAATMPSTRPYVVIFGIMETEHAASNFKNSMLSLSQRILPGGIASNNATKSNEVPQNSYAVDWFQLKIPPSSPFFHRISKQSEHPESATINHNDDNYQQQEQKSGDNQDMQSLVNHLLDEVRKVGPNSTPSTKKLLDLISHSPTKSPHPFVVFDSVWTPIYFSSRKTPLDSALILHAAKIKQEEKQRDENAKTKDDNDDTSKNEKGSNDCDYEVLNVIDRTIVPDMDTVKEMVTQGDLPSVPVRRQSLHQQLIQQSVNLFFHRETVRFFACQPYRFSPRTIYRFPAPACKGYVALSIDDCPCRMNSTANSKLPQVLDLLQKYDAKATFMAIEQFISYPSHQNDLIRLLKDGHEFANHGIKDEPMDGLVSPPPMELGDKLSATVRRLSTSDNNTASPAKQDNNDNDQVGANSNNGSDDLQLFLKAIDRCNNRIEELQEMALGRRVGVKWFRAPHGRYTKQMERGLEQRNMYNVMCDAYAVDPIVEQGSWIGQSLLRQTSDGSIILIHMPEVGFRDYCYEALEILLNGLSKRGMKVVTVSQLQSIANEED